MRFPQILSLISSILLLSSCLDSGNETFVLNNAAGSAGADDGLGIPYDDEAGDTPEVFPSGGGTGGGDQADESDGSGDADIPNWPVVITRQGYGYVSLTGIRHPRTQQWLELIGTGKDGQNVWLDIDGKAKAVDAFNLASKAEVRYPVRHDVVFLINNSHSMAAEVEHITQQIAAWGESMDQAGIDLRVGVVSYGEGDVSINAAHDIASVVDIEAFLFGSSESLIRGFGGANAVQMEAAAKSEDYYSGYSNECAVVALAFANDNFSFRSNSNRVYVLFTDEPNQPGGAEKWSVDFLRPASTSWLSQCGTVHSVYGGKLNFKEQALQTEKPWRLSRFTGGTAQFYSGEFTVAPLSEFIVSSAMRHSYILRFRLDSSYKTPGAMHTVRVTVKTPDGYVQRQKTKAMSFFID
ncbi:MAG: VWA domain-containing protein [Clostridium sp.]|nr:VWA domain-containing protein [Clostridium sp.]